MSKIFVPALPGQQQRILRLLILSWVVGTMAFWCWFSQPGAQVSLQGSLINVGLLLYVTGLPVWPFYLLMRMQKVREDLVVPPPAAGGDGGNQSPLRALAAGGKHPSRDAGAKS